MRCRMCCKTFFFQTDTETHMYRKKQDLQPSYSPAWRQCRMVRAVIALPFGHISSGIDLVLTLTRTVNQTYCKSHECYQDDCISVGCHTGLYFSVHTRFRRSNFCIFCAEFSLRACVRSADIMGRIYTSHHLWCLTYSNANVKWYCTEN